MLLGNTLIAGGALSLALLHFFAFFHTKSLAEEKLTSRSIRQNLCFSVLQRPVNDNSRDRLRMVVNFASHLRRDKTHDTVEAQVARKSVNHTTSVAPEIDALVIRLNAPGESIRRIEIGPIHRGGLPHPHGAPGMHRIDRWSEISATFPNGAMQALDEGHISSSDLIAGNIQPDEVELRRSATGQPVLKLGLIRTVSYGRSPMDPEFVQELRYNLATKKFEVVFDERTQPYYRNPAYRHAIDAGFGLSGYRPPPPTW